MKILKFSAQNIKGLRVVEIEPEGDVVIISGKNGAGKSTVVDSIERTLCGGHLALSQGAEKGGVNLDMGEFTVSRVITQKTDRLIVKNQEGAQYPSPRAFLEKFVGPLSIDPLAFIRLEDRKQLEVIFRLNPDLKPALNTADEAIAHIKALRSEILRDGKRLAHDLEKAPYNPDVSDPVSVKSLMEELEAAEKNNDTIRDLAEDAQVVEADIANNEQVIREAQFDIQSLEVQIQVLREKIKEKENVGRAAAKALKEYRNVLEGSVEVATDEIRNRIKEAEEINWKVRQNVDRRKLEEDKNSKSVEYTFQGIELKKAEDARASLLENAQMPIEGLSVSGQGVTYNGIPMSEISTSERVRVGASIAVAQNPKAEIILVDDASLLDADNLKILHEICAGFQIWQVVNDATGNEGFFIEAGELVYTNATVEDAT